MKNVSRTKQKEKQVDGLKAQIETQRKTMKSLVAELEDSVVQQIKIPQLQLLHTEYSRLKELETKLVDQLLKRKADIKDFAKQNGGRVPKDDGVGIVIRKELTSTRSKLKVVQSKIKKFGALGKIPMGASMRVYQENSDEESSVQSSTEQEDDDDASLSSFGSDGAFKKKRDAQKAKRNREVLASGLVYQPVFEKVVKMSSKNLPMMSALSDQ